MVSRPKVTAFRYLCCFRRFRADCALLRSADIRGLEAREPLHAKAIVGGGCPGSNANPAPTVSERAEVSGQAVAALRTALKAQHSGVARTWLEIAQGDRPVFRIRIHPRTADATLARTATHPARATKEHQTTNPRHLRSSCSAPSPSGDGKAGRRGMRLVSTSSVSIRYAEAAPHGPTTTPTFLWEGRRAGSKTDSLESAGTDPSVPQRGKAQGSIGRRFGGNTRRCNGFGCGARP